MPGTTEKDASLVVAPLSHGAGVHQLVQAARGVPTILLPSEKFDIAEAFRLIERHQIECDALQSGTLRAAFHARDAADVRATAEQCVRRGMPVEVLDGDAAQQVSGTSRYVCAMLDDAMSVAQGYEGWAITRRQPQPRSGT